MFQLPEPVFDFLMVLPAFLLGIGLHEWAHAWTADRLGDSTAADEGRLSLNPLDHLDPIGTLIILLAVLQNLPLIGWGKPVPVSRGRFRRPIVDSMKVALAGPMMNLAIASAAFFLWALLLRSGAIYHLPSDTMVNVHQMVFLIATVNLSLAVFNMLPVPPLDGSKVLENFVNTEKLILMRQIEPYGMLILLVLVQTPILRIPLQLFQGGALQAWGSLALSGTALLLTAGAWAWFVRSLRR